MMHSAYMWVHKAPELTDDAVLSTSDQDHVKGKKEKKLRSSSPRTAGMREDCFCLFLDEESFSPLACLSRYLAEALSQP